MTNRELDQLIEEDVQFLKEEERLELRVEELEKQVEKLAVAASSHHALKQRWAQMLHLIGQDGTINPQTFDMFNQEELMDDQMMAHCVRQISRAVQLGLDFEFILKGIEANETLAAQWRNMLMTMKMYHEETNDKAQ